MEKMGIECKKAIELFGSLNKIPYICTRIVIESLSETLWRNWSVMLV